MGGSAFAKVSARTSFQCRVAIWMAKLDLRDEGGAGGWGAGVGGGGWGVAWAGEAWA